MTLAEEQSQCVVSYVAKTEKEQGKSGTVCQWGVQLYTLKHKDTEIT